MVITQKTLPALKAAYESNKHDPEATFMFEGEELLVGYAKYLIEHLELEFANVKTRNTLS